MPDRNAVLIVDDDPSMLRSLKRLLRQQGFEPVVFESAAGLRAHAGFERARCMVLDINLRDGSGIVLQRELAAAGITLPVVYITGNDDEATRHSAMTSGCLAYLVKPFAAKSLIAAINKS